MKLTLTKILRKSVDQNGNPFKTKDGRPYERLAIKAQEYGDQWLSGFSGSWNKFWVEGKTVETEVKEVFKDGKTFLNFERIDENKILQEKINNIEERVKTLELYIKGGAKTTSAGNLIPFDDAKAEETFEEIPW